MSIQTQTYGDPTAEAVLIQPIAAREGEDPEREREAIAAHAGDLPFCLVTLTVEDWNRELSPWPAPPVFGAEGFGGGAAETLDRLLGELLPSLERPDRVFYLGGYSLAGLFALWAAHQTDRFAGVAAVSPSVWFPGFLDYAREHTPRTRAVYLSLGDAEERTRNPVMATVGDAIRALEQRYAEELLPCRLDWNPGNHFREPETRTAKGFAWLLERRAQQLRRVSQYEAMMRMLCQNPAHPDRGNLRRALQSYYESPLWKQDFLDDEAGLLPRDLPRGVLSEDGLYNLLTE